MKLEVVVEKNSGHCRPSKVLRCVCCGDSRVSSVPRHHPFEGCEGHNMCASTATHRAPWRADTNVGKRVPIFWMWGGQQVPIHRDMNKSADFVCFVKE